MKKGIGIFLALCMFMSPGAGFAAERQISGSVDQMLAVQEDERWTATGDIDINAKMTGIALASKGSEVDFSGYQTNISIATTYGSLPVSGIEVLGENAKAKLNGTIEVSGSSLAAGIRVGAEDDHLHTLAKNAEIEFTGDIKATGVGAVGVDTKAAGSVVKVKGGRIEASGQMAKGVSARNGSNAIIESDITVSGCEAGGVSALDQGTSLDVTGNITVCGETGVKASNYGYAHVKGDVFVYGDGAMGVTAQNNGFADIDGNTFVYGDCAAGLSIYEGGKARVSGDITVHGGNGWGVLGYAFSNARPTASIEGNIFTSGDNTFGVYAMHCASLDVVGNVVTEGENAIGVYADDSFFGIPSYQGAEVNINGSVYTKGEGAHGLFADNGALITMKNGVLSADTTGNTWQATVHQGGSIYMENVVAGGEGVNLLGTDCSGSLTASGSLLMGNVLHNGLNVSACYDILDVTLDDESDLRGAINGQGWGRVDVAIFNNARWSITEDSATQGILYLESKGTLDYNRSALATTATVGALFGDGGVLAMKTDIARETSDRLVVEGCSSGTHEVVIANQGSAKTTGDERTMLIETADQGANFTLAGDYVEAGAWKYALRENNDGNGRFDPCGGRYWELYGVGPSDPGSGGVNTFIGSYFLNYIEMNTLIKRLGDLRGDQQYSRHGAWFRTFGGKLESDARTYTGAFDMDYWGVQVGYDNLLDRDSSWFKNGDTYVGAYIGFSNGDQDFNQSGYGKGDLENRTMGLYWTYIGDTGYYFDAVARYVWSKNNFDVRDSAGTTVHGGGLNMGGVGLSLETGKRIRFTDGGRRTKATGLWYAEPQAQLSWQHMGGGTFHASSGLAIGVDGFDSLIGRLGVLVGYENANTNFYAKLSYLKEFDGDINVRANGCRIYESLDDSWWVYGIGVTHQLNARNALYFDIERSAGGDFTQNWNLNAGWRIMF